MRAKRRLPLPVKRERRREIILNSESHCQRGFSQLFSLYPRLFRFCKQYILFYAPQNLIEPQNQSPSRVPARAHTRHTAHSARHYDWHCQAARAERPERRAGTALPRRARVMRAAQHLQF